MSASRSPAIPPPPSRGGILRGPVGTFLATIAACLLAACNNQPPPPAPAAAPSAPAATATPTPTPTPVPRQQIEGGVVIKLPRGVDVGAGLPVMLLERTTLERIAGDASDEMEELLLANVKETEELQRAVATARTRLLELGRTAESAYDVAVREARDAEVSEGDPDAGRLRSIQNQLSNPFRDPLYKPDAAATHDQARERLAAIEAAIRADIEKLQRDAAEDIARGEEELRREREKYDATYQYRPELARVSEAKIADYERQVNRNPHHRVRNILQTARAAATRTIEQCRAEMATLENDVLAKLTPRLTAARAWIETEYPRLQAEAFERALAEATVDRVYANDRGRFSFSAEEGDYLLHALYEDTMTGQRYLWILPVTGGDNILSTYNTLSQELLAHMPSLRRLLTKGG